MHTDSEMTGISRSGSMHYMTAASLEMSDEPYIIALCPKELTQIVHRRFVGAVGTATRRVIIGKNSNILSNHRIFRRILHHEIVVCAAGETHCQRGCHEWHENFLVHC